MLEIVKMDGGLKKGSYFCQRSENAGVNEWMRSKPRQYPMNKWWCNWCKRKGMEMYEPQKGCYSISMYLYFVLYFVFCIVGEGKGRSVVQIASTKHEAHRTEHLLPIRSELDIAKGALTESSSTSRDRDIGNKWDEVASPLFKHASIPLNLSAFWLPTSQYLSSIWLHSRLLSFLFVKYSRKVCSHLHLFAVMKAI